MNMLRLSLLGILLILASSPVSAAAPTCVPHGEEGPFYIERFRLLRFETACSGNGGDLEYVEWYVDDLRAESLSLDRTTQATTTADILFPTRGQHTVTAIAGGTSGRSQPAAWQVDVSRPPAPHAPTCQLLGPAPPSQVVEGNPVSLQVRCFLDEGRLDRVLWFLDAALVEEDGSEALQSTNAAAEVRMWGLGRHILEVVALNSAGDPGPPLAWDVDVVAAPEVTTSEAPEDEEGRENAEGPAAAASWWTEQRWGAAAVGTASSAVLGGIAKVLHSRRRQGRAASSAGSVHGAHGNRGTVVGSAGTVVIHAGPTDDDTPPRVPVRRRPLYLALQEAQDVLDDPAGGPAAAARELVRSILESLEKGESPRAEIRHVAIEAIERARAHPTPRLRAGEPALATAVRELRR